VELLPREQVFEQAFVDFLRFHPEAQLEMIESILLIATYRKYKEVLL